jgi:hypothetical protein
MCVPSMDVAEILVLEACARRLSAAGDLFLWVPI